MSRGKKGADTSAKAQLSRSPSYDEDISAVRKPGLESSLPHISQMFLETQPELAVELTQSLRPHLAQRLGIRRTAPRRGR